MSNLSIEENVLQKNKYDEYKYVRHNCNELQILSLKFEELYSYKALILTSGNHAINILLRYILFKFKNKKINIIIPNELYYESNTNFYKLKEIFDFSIIKFNILEQEKELIDYANRLYIMNTADIHVIFVESCSNPNGYCINYEVLQKFKDKVSNTLIIVDNTWLSSILCNPFDYKCIDFVVNSLTKYYTGGTIISGAIIPKNDYDGILDLIKLEGIHISPIICNNILDKISSLNERLIISSNNTIKILNELLKIKDICLSHPYIYNNKFNNDLYPSVFTVTIYNLTKDKLISEIKKLNINYKTSFGGPDTKIDTYHKINHDNSITLRISIGYIDNFIIDLDLIKNLIINLLN